MDRVRQLIERRTGRSLGWCWLVATFLIWVYLPEVRRVMDWRAGGYSALSIITALPLLSTIPFAIGILRIGVDKLSKPFAMFAIVWVAAFGWAACVGLYFGQGAAAVLTFVNFTFPMFVGLWISLQKEAPGVVRERIAAALLVAATGSALYGIYQWIAPPPWDQFWVENSQILSIGHPEPFGLRVFGTLNSNGPFADFLSFAIAMNFFRLSFRRPAVMAAIVACIAALLLTFARTDWIAVALGLAAFIAFTPNRKQIVLPLAMVIGMTVLVATSLPIVLGDDPSNANIIVDRASSLGAIDTDDSANVRSIEIDKAVTAGLDSPVGRGLGIIGTAAKLNDSQQLAVNLDSGYLARLLEMGYYGFFGYVLVVFGALFCSVFVYFRLRGSEAIDLRRSLAIGITVQLMGIWIDAATDDHLDLPGICIWIGIALTLGTPAWTAVVRSGRLSRRLVQPQCISAS